MLSMNYFNDTFLIILQKSIIEVSSGCLDGMKLYVFLILSGIAFASYIRGQRKRTEGVFYFIVFCIFAL